MCQINGSFIHTFKTKYMAEYNFIPVTEERRIDMLVGALEGGSNYWYWLGDAATAIFDKYRKAGDALADTMYAALKAGESIPVEDVENDGEVLGTISMESIEKGERLMYGDMPNDFHDIADENDDASTADIWFQYATLGEVVYG